VGVVVVVFDAWYKNGVKNSTTKCSKGKELHTTSSKVSKEGGSKKKNEKL
jgi:hypothetical protein